MSAFLFYTIPSIRLIHPSLFCIFCKFFEIRCSNSASYFKCQISMSSIIPYLLILYVLSKLHDRIKHFSIFLRCKRTAPHRILSCIWVISLFSSLVLVAIKNTYIPKAQKEPLWASDDYSVYFVCLKRGHFVKENGHFLLIFLLGWYILF